MDLVAFANTTLSTPPYDDDDETDARYRSQGSPGTVTGKEREKKEINARKAKQYYTLNERDRPLFFTLWNTIGTLRTLASSLGSCSLVCANYVLT